MDYRYTFTVFTPTYNRAHTLHRVYESLLAQTFRDFEWLVVDDGSTDNTAELLAGWQAEAPFPMRVHTQENRGKPVASNRAAELAQGELMVSMDSDDACLPHTLECLLNSWLDIPEDRRDEFCAVICPYQDLQGRILGGPFPRDPLDGYALDLYYRLGLLRERWGFRRTEFMRRFPFPEIPGHFFISEALIWNRMDRLYLNRFINEPLLVYHLNPMEKTSKRLLDFRCNAPGYVFWHGESLSQDLRYFRFAPGKFLAVAMHYGRFSRHAGWSLVDQWKFLTNWRARALWLVCLPMAFLVWCKDRLLIKRHGRDAE